MPGSPSFDLSPVAQGIAVQAAPVIVARYAPGSENTYTVISNIRCLRIDYREGPEPPVARFQYVLDNNLEVILGWPSRFEKLWPIDAQGNYVVLNDDRLVVLTADPEGNPVVLFDGFAEVPQIDVAAAGQNVSFVAVGVAIRLWDDVIKTRVQRQASSVTVVDGSSDVTVQLPCRFNPSNTSIGSEGGYIGNCVPSDSFTESERSDDSFPVFLDPLISERGADKTSYWFVSDALSYLISVHESPQDEGGAPYVLYPEIASLETALSCQPPPDDGMLSKGDAESSNIKIRDYDCTNRAVPEAMAELLRYCGFVMVFYTDTYTDGTPETHLKVVRRDALASQKPKLLYLNALGSTQLDLTTNNVTQLHLARDSNAIMNQWVVETAVEQFEITVTLAPGFTKNATDATGDNRKKFFKSNLTSATADERRMYRWWIADECADGHYDMESASFVTGKSLDLTAIWPDGDKGAKTYVDRYRPGSNTLISKAESGEPLKAILQVKKGQKSSDPMLVTDPDDPGDSSWITIPHGVGWKLLKDRLGIEVTTNDPDDFTTGASHALTGQAVPKIKACTDVASPASDADNFALRLTTVIEGDQTLAAEAKKRKASPTKFARERRIDGKDHFQYCAIAKGSIYYETQTDINGDMSDGSSPLVMRDDTKAAVTHAQQLRSAHEFPTLAGSATIPFITDYYQIGDRVQIVKGRNASLQINVGVDQGEAPSFPWITAFAWDFQGDKQQTILQFSDRRAEPQGV